MEIVILTLALIGTFAAGFIVGVKAMKWSISQKADEIIKDLEQK